MKINELEALRKRNLFQIESKFSKRLVRENVNLTVTPYFRIFLSKWIFTPFLTRLAIKVPLTSHGALYGSDPFIGSFAIQFFWREYGTTVKPMFIFGCLSSLD